MLIFKCSCKGILLNSANKYNGIQLYYTMYYNFPLVICEKKSTTREFSKNEYCIKMMEKRRIISFIIITIINNTNNTTTNNTKKYY